MVNPSTTTTGIKSPTSRVPPANNNTKSNHNQNSNSNSNNKSGNSKTKKRTSQTTVPLSYRNAENKNESVPSTTTSPRLLSSTVTATTSQDRNLNRSGNNGNVNNSAVSCGVVYIDDDKRSFTKSNNKFRRSTSHNINNNKNSNYRNVGNCTNWRSSSTSDFSSSVKSSIKFVPIEAPSRPILSSTSIAGVLSDQDSIILLEKYGKGRYTYPIMQVSLFSVSLFELNGGMNFYLVS